MLDYEESFEGVYSDLFRRASYRYVFQIIGALKKKSPYSVRKRTWIVRAISYFRIDSYRTRDFHTDIQIEERIRITRGRL